MKTHNIQQDKLNLIAWISQLQDEAVINKLKNIQIDNIEIPKWQQDIVEERLKAAKPDDYVDWEKVKNDFLDR